MQQPFNIIHQQLLQNGQVLKTLACNEHAFLKMESLFYDILTNARLQKESLLKEELLAQLQKVKVGKFQLTQLHYQKARQREVAICQFRTALSKVLASYLKAAKYNRSGGEV